MFLLCSSDWPPAPILLPYAPKSKDYRHMLQQVRSKVYVTSPTTSLFSLVLQDTSSAYLSLGAISLAMGRNRGQGLGSI